MLSNLIQIFLGCLDDIVVSSCVSFLGSFQLVLVRFSIVVRLRYFVFVFSFFFQNDFTLFGIVSNSFRFVRFCFKGFRLLMLFRVVSAHFGLVSSCC